LRAKTRKTLRLIRADLRALGVSDSEYTQINHPRTQAIGAAVAFLGCDGLVAPSARWDCDHLMIFSDNHGLKDELSVLRTEEVNWQAWARDKKLL
jgi:hypothetical protein